jgi:hypothetical protein
VSEKFMPTPKSSGDILALDVMTPDANVFCPFVEMGQAIACHDAVGVLWMTAWNDDKWCRYRPDQAQS